MYTSGPGILRRGAKRKSDGLKAGRPSKRRGIFIALQPGVTTISARPGKRTSVKRMPPGEHGLSFANTYEKVPGFEKPQTFRAFMKPDGAAITTYTPGVDELLDYGDSIPGQLEALIREIRMCRRKAACPSTLEQVSASVFPLVYQIDADVEAEVEFEHRHLCDNMAYAESTESIFAFRADTTEYRNTQREVLRIRAYVRVQVHRMGFDKHLADLWSNANLSVSTGLHTIVCGWIHDLWQRAFSFLCIVADVAYENVRPDIPGDLSNPATPDRSVTSSSSEYQDCIGLDMF